jgi:predicted NodU family carbamoyl transferase
MNVLGISGRYRDAAAAVAIDGSLAAAASEDSFVGIAGVGYTQTGGFPHAAVEACLAKTGLTPPDIDRITIVDDRDSLDFTDASVPNPAVPPWHAGSTTSETIDPLFADAIQVAASAEEVDAVLICSTHPPVLARFERQGTGVSLHSRLAGGEQLMGAARTLATSLGIATDDPFSSLDRLSIGGEAEFHAEMAAVICWDPATGVAVDSERLARLIRTSGHGETEKLRDATSLNARIQETRRSLAASFTHGLARLVCDVSQGMLDRDRSCVGLGGGMSANPRFTTEVRQLVGDRLQRAALPERVGRALGAALGNQLDEPPRLPGLTLGPTYTDYDIKRTLDNCRLDYVYEPDWRRLIDRISAMLSQGKVIGWFQGALAFGPRPLGSRSVLCDPSGRYARQNINEYLRHGPLDEPLPIVFAPSMADACLADAPIKPHRVIDSAVKPEWRDRLTSALDWRHHVRVQPLSPVEAPALCDLVERHFERTGIPAVIETPLGGVGEPLACSPRDAVRTVYSSAIDALVMDRFLLMKDYWLLRSDGA